MLRLYERRKPFLPEIENDMIGTRPWTCLRPRATSAGCIALLVWITAVVAHGVYVSEFAGRIPFWDQWDELHGFFLPWVDGQWRFDLLIAAHNQHRIAFTRLLSLLLFVLNGNRWGNLVEAYVNCVVYGAQFFILYLMLGRSLSGVAKLLFSACALVLVALPFGWENTLVGFQNSFYFMNICAVSVLAIGAWRTTSPWTILWLCIVVVVSLFTLASGVLAGVALIGVLVMAHWCGRSTRAVTATAVTATALLVAVGLHIIPGVQGPDGLKARSLLDWYNAISAGLMWPLNPFGSSRSAMALRALPIVLIWLPCASVLLRVLHSRKAAPEELFALGVAGWAVLQTLAIAAARGHDVVYLSSRYTDTLSVGALANIWLALRLLSRCDDVRRSATQIAAACCALAAMGWGLVSRTPGDFVQMRERGLEIRVQAIAVDEYVDGRNSDLLLSQPPIAIPDATAQSLLQMLDDPRILHLLAAASKWRLGRTLPPAELSGLAVRLQRRASSMLGTDPPSMQFEPRTASVQEHGTAQPAHCSLDAIDGAPPATANQLQAGRIARYAGWVTTHAGTVPATFEFVLHGPETLAITARAGSPRPDVAKALHSPHAVNAGFDILAALPAAVKRGRYGVMIALTHDGSIETCATGRFLSIE